MKPDPGVVPTDEMCDDAGIEVVKTDFQHDHMSDRGPDTVKESIRTKLERFLAEDKPPKKPAERKQGKQVLGELQPEPELAAQTQFESFKRRSSERRFLFVIASEAKQSSARVSAPLKSG